MLKTTRKHKEKKSDRYSHPENVIEFYVSEETASYGNNGKKPFTIFYDNPDHSIRLLKGDCIEILNQARENSVDMIFADPPYFLSNGGITCHAGKMVSVNKASLRRRRGLSGRCRSSHTRTIWSYRERYREGRRLLLISQRHTRRHRNTGT